jgi:hypothetical protein
MTHEKLIKRENGDKVRLRIRLFVESWRDAFAWNFEVWVTPKGKRKEFTPFNGDDYTYRRLGVEDRKKWEERKYMEYVTPEEIQQAKIELWEKIKPQP